MGRQRSRSDVASTSPKIRRLSNALRKISSISSAKDDRPPTVRETPLLEVPHTKSLPSALLSSSHYPFTALDVTMAMRRSSCRTPLTLREQRHGGDFEFGGEPIEGVSSRGSSSAGAADESDVNLRQIQQLTQRVGSTLSSKDADAAYKEYAKVKDHAALCRTLLRSPTTAPTSSGQGPGQATGTWVEGRGPSRESSLEVPQSPASANTRSSFSGRSLSEMTTSQSLGQHRGPTREVCLSAVREWKRCIESLVEALELSLSETYGNYEPDATPNMVKSLFQDKAFRAAAIQQMRRTSIVKTFSPNPDFFPLYDIRFRNHDRAKQDLVEITRTLQLGESGVTDERPVKELNVSPRGDAVLEFANIGAEALPVLRFRVSSFLLAETSPIFERMFTEHAHIEIHDNEDVADQLAPPPTSYICDDGTEAKLYRMPQLERDREQALTILLRAAHMHNDKIPRDVTFEQFVAIAEVCLRYRCTSPLELFVEHRWLPQWIHKGSEAMPDGWLLISYAFGFRQLFTRMSKTAILNLVDEEELRAMSWPQRIKDKIWGVRGAKMAQVHECCVNVIREYLRPPSSAVEQDRATVPAVPLKGPLQVRNRSPVSSKLPAEASSTATVPALMFTSTPRCPKGSHGCDATNLGWLMLIYGELQLLPTIMNPSVLGHLAGGDQQQQQQHSPPRRSLAQLVNLLRTMASSPLAIHKGGVCDPAPPFRAAINDIYNSVSGLTLHDVSGRAHGWGLSRHRSTQPQAVLHRGLRNFSSGKKPELDAEQGQSNILEWSDALRLLILEKCVDSLDDLRAAAMVNQRFYETFRKNEVVLMRRFVGDQRLRTLMKLTSMDVVAGGEDKVPREEADVMKAEAKAAHGVEDVVSVDEWGRERLAGDGGTRVGNQLDQGQGADETVANVFLAVPSSPAGGGASAFDDNSSSEEEMLSEAEARRILWPPEVTVSPARNSSSSPQRQALGSGSDISAEDGIMREKFRTGDAAFVEEKMLLEGEDKHLRDERDRRVGLMRGDG
ncbi:hypothetical protein CORC01_01132 [Colletotrichum orchidophilum]|uniref:BTB domain-containing protein n=1 Tax=Colletotrichum orchidophilum TaxID=1209926 RepID=A0A1G4BQ26_9PEZI|nr:uncharacterized protein CORC01_01132 [Colletotrichum orchidophilum]OHF03413.1 hypothetical protein CORC01_01132 [Colletotrichum orchidophilum]